VVAAAVLLLLVPVRLTLSFGQINLVLIGARGRRLPAAAHVVAAAR
jgi:hypothetical protein